MIVTFDETYLQHYNQATIHAVVSLMFSISKEIQDPKFNKKGHGHGSWIRKIFWKLSYQGLNSFAITIEKILKCKRQCAKQIKSVCLQDNKPVHKADKTMDVFMNFS